MAPAATEHRFSVSSHTYPTLLVPGGASNTIVCIEWALTWKFIHLPAVKAKHSPPHHTVPVHLMRAHYVGNSSLSHGSHCVLNRRVGLPERKLYEFELVFIEMRM